MGTCLLIPARTFRGQFVSTRKKPDNFALVLLLIQFSQVFFLNNYAVVVIVHRHFSREKCGTIRHLRCPLVRMEGSGNVHADVRPNEK